LRRREGEGQVIPSRSTGEQPVAGASRRPAARCAIAFAALALAAAGATPAAPAAAVPPARIAASFDAAAFAVGDEGIRSWIQRSATIVAGYYGRFPAPTLRLAIVPVAGRGVQGGTAYPGPGPGIRVRLGRDSSAAALAADWVLVHEMIHLALPEVGESHAWLSEGLATYVEGMARVAAGNLSAAALWQEYVESMPKGEPGPGDAGLDHTHSWARTYWGGALYCLDADVAIRAATGNRRGLRDALRAILEASGGMRVEWPIARVLATGDAATGTDVLERLYRERGERPVATDLAALWTRLGVSESGGRVELSGEGPAAELRRSLTASDPAPPAGAVEIVSVDAR
jgi:hypothetical protein